MKLNVLTICLNSMPYLSWHLEQFEKSGTDFHWVIVHGPANNTGSTSWCKKPEEGLSTDGTTEYLQSIKDHPRVTVLESPMWEHGKDQMVNAGLAEFKDGGVLMQIDSDETWAADQLAQIVKIFAIQKDIGHMRFYCRYFVGNGIITLGESYGNRVNKGEWARCWRWMPGTRFMKHEPPVLPVRGRVMTPRETRAKGLVFDHFSWVDPENVRRKIAYYGYGQEAFEGWKRLQANTKWPVNNLRDFLPWADDRVQADRIEL